MSMLPVDLDLDLRETFKTSGSATVCIVCFKRIIDYKLQKCSSCKMVFYCGKEHQKLHWPKHKEFCKSVQLMKQETDKKFLEGLSRIVYVDPGNAFELWWQKLAIWKSLCEIYLKRELTPDEKRLFYNQLNCNICYSYKNNQMIICKDCGIAPYCSEEHKLQDKLKHSASCSDIKFCLDFDINCNKKFRIIGGITDVTKLPKNMQTFIDRNVVVKTMPHVGEPYVNSYLSNCLTVPLTLIYAIEKSNIYRGQDTLNIHVVGSGPFESNTAWWGWEYIFHRFKKLETVNFFFIGPESNDFFLPPALLCPECKRRRRTSNFTIDTSLYHDFVKKNTSPSPDVIVAYNCGFHENQNFPDNTWRDSIPDLCKNRGSVIVFTSYMGVETKEDLNFFLQYSKSDSVKILVKNEENPFKSLMPYYDCFSKNRSVYYNNNFINICSL